MSLILDAAQLVLIAAGVLGVIGAVRLWWVRRRSSR